MTQLVDITEDFAFQALQLEERDKAIKVLIGESVCWIPKAAVTFWDPAQQLLVLRRWFVVKRLSFAPT